MSTEGFGPAGHSGSHCSHKGSRLCPAMYSYMVHQLVALVSSNVKLNMTRPPATVCNVMKSCADSLGYKNITF